MHRCSKPLKYYLLAQLVDNDNSLRTGVEEIFGQIQLDIIRRDMNDVLIRHFNKLSYLVLSDSSKLCLVTILNYPVFQFQNLFAGFEAM